MSDSERNGITHSGTIYTYTHTPWVKKGDTIGLFLSISLLNIDRFSQFFHQSTQLERRNKIINKDPTSPQICCYTTVPCEMFQQDSALAHRARETIKLLQRETPAFISPDLWPLNSSHLNPVDYKICGVTEDRVYQKKTEGRERVERATGWGLGRTATERDWRCHQPVAQTPACLRSG